MAWLLVGLGVGQIGLIVAAFSRLIDPGWPAYGAIGTLAGLGVAAGCLAAMTSARSRHASTFRLISVVALLAGLVYAGAWLSLLGTTFWLDDAPRIGTLVASDVIVAVSFLLAGLTLERPRPSGFLSVAVYLSVRAIIEARYLAGVLNPPPPQPAGTSSGIEGIFVGAVILSGFVLLAFWEISLARWMLGRRRLPAI